MEALIKAAVGEANSVLKLSGIGHVRVAIAHSQLAPSGRSDNDSTGQVIDLRKQLGWVSFDDESLPFLPSSQFPSNPPANNAVLALRDTHNADVVTMVLGQAAFVDETQVPPVITPLCGAAQVSRRDIQFPFNPGRNWERLAYSVVQLDCAIGFLDFTHELGHLNGLEHNPVESDAFNSGTKDPACTGSFAWRSTFQTDPALTRRTVVSGFSQAGISGDFGCPGGSTGCPAVPLFSNPNLEWNGTAIVAAGSTQPPSGAVPLGAFGQAQNWRTFGKLAPLTSEHRIDPDEVFFSSFEGTTFP